MKDKYKVSEKDIEEAIVQEIFIPIGNKTMVCLLVLGTEEEVCGSHTVVDPDNIDILESKRLARADAKAKAARSLHSIYQWQKTGEERARLKAEAKAKAKEGKDAE